MEEPPMKHNPRRLLWKPACLRRCLSASIPMRRASIAGPRALCGRAAGSRLDAGPIVQDLYERSASPGGLAAALRHHERGHGSRRGSTGFRSIEILEARGLDVRLVNARHVKNVPGRKSDVSDCEWLRELAHASACCGAASGPVTTSSRFAAISAIGRRCWRAPASISSACRRRSCK